MSSDSDESTKTIVDQVGEDIQDECGAVNESVDERGAENESTTEKGSERGSEKAKKKKRKRNTKGSSSQNALKESTWNELAQIQAQMEEQEWEGKMELDVKFEKIFPVYKYYNIKL